MLHVDRTRGGASIWVGVIAVFLLAVTQTSCDGQEPESELRKITVAQWGKERYLIYLPFYIAVQEGIFNRNRIDVEIVFSGNDDQVFSTVLQGSAQFGIGDPIFAAISTQRGIDGVVVAAIVDRVALWGVRDENKPISSPSDFAGLRIGTFPRPSTTYSLTRQMIDENGVEGAQIVEVPIGSELSLLGANAADVVMLLEPAASIAESEGLYVVTSFPDLWGAYAFTGLTTTRSFATDNDDVVKGMYQSLDEALKLAHSDPQLAVDVAQALFPELSEEVVESAVLRMLRDQTIPLSAAVDEKGWDKALSIRKDLGDLPVAFECDGCINITVP